MNQATGADSAASELTPNLADDPRTALSCPPAAARSVMYRLRFALHAAVMAPSVHNTQPWRFRVVAGDDPFVELLMDPTRELPALDPEHRQLVMSCGAALAAYEIGLRGLGLEPQAEIFPADAGPACLARVRVRDLGTADPQARELFQVLQARRTYRGPMTMVTLPDSVRETLAAATSSHSVLDYVADAQWRDVEHLVVDAAIELSDTTDVDAEVRSWTRLNERTSDGVPATNWQRTSEQTAGASVVQRDFAQGRDLPGGPAPTGIEGDPVLAVLVTPTDSPVDWVHAGADLLRVSLAAQSVDVALGYVNQPTEVPGMRERLTELLRPMPKGFAVPQVVLRLGYPGQELPPATPRRTVASVLLG